MDLDPKLTVTVPSTVSGSKGLLVVLVHAPPGNVIGSSPNVSQLGGGREERRDCGYWF